MIPQRIPALFWQHLKIYAISPNNLGLFRIMLGSAILFQLIVYLVPVIPVSYYNDGLIDVKTYHQLVPSFCASVFDLFSSHLLVNLYFGLTMLVALAFTLGYKTRVTSVFLLVLLWNIYQRGGLVSGTESRYAIALLTLACFLPLNATFAIDRFKEKYLLSEKYYLLACMAIIVQVGWIYLSTGLQKSDTEWFNGTALQIAFHDPLNTHAFWMDKDFSDTRILCILVILGEILIGLGWMFYPKNKSLVRWVLSLGVMGLHLGILVFLNLWHFSAFATAAAMLLLPIRSKTDVQVVAQEVASKKWQIRLLLAYLSLISLANLQMISKFSIIRQPLQKMHITRMLNVVKIYGRDIASPFNQYWRLYGIIPDKLGCVRVSGWDTKGNEYDLIRQNLLSHENCCPYDNLGQKEYLEMLRIPFMYAEFKNVEAYYSLHTRRLLQAWNEKYPGSRLDSVKMSFWTADGIVSHETAVLRCDEDSCKVVLPEAYLKNDH